MFINSGDRFCGLYWGHFLISETALQVYPDFLLTRFFGVPDTLRICVSRVPQTGYTKTGYMTSSWDPVINMNFERALGAIRMNWSQLEWIVIQQTHSSSELCDRWVDQKSITKGRFDEIPQPHPSLQLNPTPLHPTPPHPTSPPPPPPARPQLNPHTPPPQPTTHPISTLFSPLSILESGLQLAHSTLPSLTAPHPPPNPHPTPTSPHLTLPQPLRPTPKTHIQTNAGEARFFSRFVCTNISRILASSLSSQCRKACLLREPMPDNLNDPKPTGTSEPAPRFDVH